MPPAKSSRIIKSRTVSRNDSRESLADSRKTTNKGSKPGKIVSKTVSKAAPKRVAVVKRRATGTSKAAASKASFTVVGVRRASILLKQVSDPTRLQILLLLAASEHNVGAICNELGGQSQPAVSHHLAKLRDGRLIEPRREGKNNVYALTEEGRLLAHTVKSLTWLKG
ncbi:MAG: ArsR family transcriptional regulator [Planctomycetota bacterium]|nr:MAG: ArsR family transcriptional regulator [Planctomycetota bacterium]